MHTDDEQIVRVQVDRDVFGRGYTTVVAFDDDNVLHLDRDALHAYVETMVGALTRAQYSEAVRQQIKTVNGGALTDRHAIETVLELRQEWPDLPTFGPYRIVPVTSIEGRPSVEIQRGGRTIVQMRPGNVAEHVVQTLQVYAAADLDSAYRRYLVSSIGVGEDLAAGAIDKLGEHFPDADGINGLTGTHPRTKRGRRRGRR